MPKTAKTGAGRILPILTAATVLAALLMGLYATSRYSFLLFHTMAEMAAISVLIGTFLVAWNTRHFVENHYLLFVGTAAAFVAGITLLHTLAYEGMGVFVEHTANLPTQLWIAGQYLLAVSMLAALFFVGRRLNAYVLVMAFAGLTTALLVWVFSDAFPDCFIPVASRETGRLTAFKIVSEYVICGILALSMAGLWLKRRHFQRDILLLLIAALAAMIVSELAFTEYVSVYGPASLVGHMLRVVSFALLYKAIIQGTLKQPYRTLFRELGQSRDQLQQKVTELQKALAEVRTLSGLLPICSACKKVRDDDGYWQQIEEYITERSQAQFSHSLCEHCLQELYPDIYRDKASSGGASSQGDRTRSDRD